MTAVPNILVHGAWADGSLERRDRSRLGFTTTMQLPRPRSRRRPRAAGARRQNGPTVLAGHSYGGQVITALGTDAPNVRRPRLHRRLRARWRATSINRLGPGQDRPALAPRHRRAIRRVAAGTSSRHFAGDLGTIRAPRRAATHVDAQRRRFARLEGLPSWYLVATADEGVYRPDAVRRPHGAPRRSRSTGSRVAMISPDETADQSSAAAEPEPDASSRARTARRTSRAGTPAPAAGRARGRSPPL